VKEILIKREKEFLKELFVIIKQEAFVCGGFARYCVTPKIMPDKVSDVDIYVKEEDNWQNIFLSFKTNNWKEGKVTDVSVTFTKDNYPHLQLIKPLKEGHISLTGNIEDILNNFDFTVSRVGIFMDNFGNIRAICDDEFEKHEVNNLLVIKNIHCPIAQIYRIAKYSKKGYFCKIKEVLKLFNDWDTRDVEYKNRLFTLIDKEDISKEEIDELERLLHID